MTLLPETAAELESLLQKLKNSEIAVIVEGKKDRAALEKLGIPSVRIFVLNSKPLFAVAEEIADDCKSVAILTDLDAEGKRLYGKLNTLLERLGVRIDNRLRDFLFKNTRIRQVEGLSF